MRVKPQLEATLRQYVLGELDEEARIELEERLVTEPDLFELLGPTEDELTEEYMENVLSATERTGFERHFLINEERRWQLGFLGLLKDHTATMVTDRGEQPDVSLADPVILLRERAIAGAAEPRDKRARVAIQPWATVAATFGSLRANPVWVGSLAASVAILLSGTVWFVLRSTNLEDELGRLRVEHEVAQREQRGLQSRVDRLSTQAQALQTKLESERQQRETIEARASDVQTQGTRPTRAQTPPLFVLATGLLRSEGSMTRIAIPPDAPLIRLRLELPGVDYPLYRAVLYDAGGEEIWAQSKLSAQAGDGRASVTLLLPARLLPPGDYQLKLSGTDGTELLESVATCAFRTTAP
jgi:hypothetical protein